MYCIFLDLEWFLAEKGIITDSELDEDPSASRKNVKKSTLSAGTRYRVAAGDSDDDDDM